MLVLIVIILIVVWVVGWLYIILDFFTLGWFGGLFRRKPPNVEPEPPYYIEDEITALYDQIDVYNRMIHHYKNDLEYTSNVEQRLKLEKKIVDLEYKCSKLENKVNKLLDKWEG